MAGASDPGGGPPSLRPAGPGRLALPEPRLGLTLASRRLDLDAFLASLKDKKATALAGLQEAVPPIDLSLRLDSVGFGGEEWTGLAAGVALARGRASLTRLQVGWPGDARLEASCTFGASFAEGGSGRIAITARAPERLAGLLQRAGLGR